MTWKNWNEGIEMSELTWRNWNERIEMNELTEGTKEGMNEGMGDWRNEGRKEGRKWMNWNEWLETNELIWKNFNERIETNELKRMNWSEWIETKELNRMNWNEWIEANELKGMDCHKCSEPLQFFFCDFYLKSSSRYILSTSSSISALRPSVFIYGLYAKSSSRYCLVHILPTSFSFIFQKWSEGVIFSRFYVINYLMTMWLTYETELSLQPCAHFVDHFPGLRLATAETETLQRRPRTATLPEKKKRRVLRPRAFSSVNSRAPDRSHFPTIDVDVVDMMIEMMMWVPWCWDS